PVKATAYTPKPDEMPTSAAMATTTPGGASKSPAQATAGASSTSKAAADTSSATKAAPSDASSSAKPPPTGTAAVAKALAPPSPASSVPAPAAASSMSDSTIVLFASGAATLDPNAGLILRSFAQSVRAGTSPIDVSGFADRTGNRVANVDLAKRRAM